LDLRAVGVARHVDALASGYPLHRALLPRLAVPTTLTDWASAAAVAEVRFGAAQGLHDVLYVQLLPRILASIVLGGRPYGGATGGAGQLAHVKRDRAETAACFCGSSGCIQTLIPVPVFPSANPPCGDAAKPIGISARRIGSATDRSWIAKAAHGIGGAIVDTCRIIDPAAVILYGEPHPAAVRLVNAVAQEVRHQAMPGLLRAPHVMNAALAARGPLVGALALAADAA
jgi:predicted NBD/HSP70 family sugar kinase